VKRSERKPFTRIEYDSRSDKLGRCHFTLSWGESGRNKAQCFFADPRKYGFPRPEERTEE
jgi:hypothetical protein